MLDTSTDQVEHDVLEARLHAAQQRLDDCRLQVELAMASRDELIIEAHDEWGWSHGRIARATGMSRTAVMKAIAEG